MKKIKDTSKTLEKVDHEKIAKLLGAERVAMPHKIRQMLKTAANIERQTLIDLLSHPAGYGVQMAGWVDIRVLESREFAVCEYFDERNTHMGGNYEEQIFTDVTDAVDEFLKIRHRLEMGLDYDEKHWREAGLREAREAREAENK